MTERYTYDHSVAKRQENDKEQHPNRCKRVVNLRIMTKTNHPMNGFICIHSQKISYKYNHFILLMITARIFFPKRKIKSFE